jgi:nucleoside triphosphate diphosphatase
MQPSNDITRLVEIMRALRAPDGGCPWDLEQSFDTIVPYTLEEAYEVADAIERRDPIDLCEELGDLLLQVVYHAQLATELELFTFDDVVLAITRKMIRRHPHVFGDADARSARSAKGQWERIKAVEKQERQMARTRAESIADLESGSEWHRPSATTRHLLDDVPGAMPSLMLAQRVQAKAAKVGFDWTELPPIIEKLREETDELVSAAASADVAACRDELGDVLFTVVNVARRLELDPDGALRGTVQKFRRRFAAMEDSATRSGTTLSALSLTEQETLWQQAKVATHSDGLR